MKYHNRHLGLVFVWLLACGVVVVADAVRDAPSSRVDLDEQIDVLNRYLDDQQWEKALGVCNRILRRNIDKQYRARVLEKRAALYWALDKYELALVDANAATALAPKDAEAYRVRSAAYVGLGRYKEAITNATRAIEIEPLGADLFFQRGMAHFQFNYYSEAIDDFTKVIQLNPARTDGRFYRALAAFNAGRDELAEEDCTKLMAEPATARGTYRLLGLTQFALGKRSEASASFERAATVEAKSESEKLANIATSHLAVFDFSTAFTFYDQALSVDPTNVKVLSDCALAHSYAGDIDGAWKYLRKALQLGKPGVHQYLLRGSLNFIDGCYQQSIEDDEIVVRLWPNVAEGYVDLGIDYMVVGRRSKAMEVFERGLQLKSSPVDKALLAIWLTLVGGKIDENTREYLMQFSDQGWPFPLVRYYFGDLSEQTVLKLAQRSDQILSRNLECLAYFYIGARLIGTNAAHARECFEKAAETAPCVGLTKYRNSSVLARKQLELDFLTPRDERLEKPNPAGGKVR